MKSGTSAVLFALGLASTPTYSRATICDIIDASPNENVRCVAAHSTTRALYSNYGGALYQVRRSSDLHVQDIKVVATGGVANAASQDTFCGTSDCVIFRIYDQSPFGNHLNLAPPGGAHTAPDNPVNATADSITLNKNKVYGAKFEGNNGYRIDITNGVAQGNDEETIVAVLNGEHFNNGCCFDYGNAESNNLDTGAGSMEALYFGNSSGWGKGAGNGPWLMADLENGLWAGDQKVNPGNPSLNHNFITGMVKGGSSGFGLKGGDAQGGNLQTLCVCLLPFLYD